MTDINKWYYCQPFVKSREEFKYEEHSNPECDYKYLNDWYIEGTQISVKIFIRICKCKKKYTSRDNFINRKTIYFEEIGDGVEVHFDDGCRFHVPDKENKLEKVGSQFDDVDSNKAPKPGKKIREFRKLCRCNRHGPTEQR